MGQAAVVTRLKGGEQERRQAGGADWQPLTVSKHVFCGLPWFSCSGVKEKRESKSRCRYQSGNQSKNGNLRQCWFDDGVEAAKAGWWQLEGGRAAACLGDLKTAGARSKCAFFSGKRCQS